MTPDRAPQWEFTEAVPEQRRRRLLAVAGFDEIIANIEFSRVVSGEVVPRWTPPLLGCSRVQFGLQVPPDVFDKFFNSPVGYRAQYLIAPDHGVAQNHRLLAALFPVLKSHLEEHDPKSVAFAVESLKGTDAKIWIEDTAGRELLGSEDLVIHINVPDWVKHARASHAGTPEDPAKEAELSKATRGVLAPEGCVLDVKGGWIDSATLSERRDPFKANRAVEIQKYGWS